MPNLITYMPYLLFCHPHCDVYRVLYWWLSGKETACNVGKPGLIPGEGNGYPLQHSCLENSVDRGAWWAAVHGIAKSWNQVSN